MPIILNQELYDKVKKEADKIYKKHSAYKSGWIVKTYKDRGGKYGDDDKEKFLKRWFLEEWGDIGKQNYPVYRPFKRITEDTPLTVSEIDPEQAKEQIKLKQVIKGKKNLPPFKPLEGSGLNKSKEILKWSNPYKVQEMANKYFDSNVKIHLSDKKEKKYMLQDDKGKWVHFGQMGYQDFTKHQDEDRRRRYLNRATNMRGDWRDDLYSPNNLSIHLLW